MHLGEKTPHPPSLRRQRLVKIGVGAVILLVLLSLVTQVTYREMPAVVVGNEFDIPSQVDGTIARIHRQVDEPYRKGDELVTVESEGLRAQLEAVERDLDQLNRSLAIEKSEEGIERRRFDLQTSIASTTSELHSCRAEIESVNHLLPGIREWRDLTAERLRRGEELRAAGALTESELDDRRRVALETDGKLEDGLARQTGLEAKEVELKEILGLYRHRLASLAAERTGLITELDLRRQEKEGLRDRLLASLRDLRIVADHDGIVTGILRKEGEYVQSGGPILRVMRGEEIWVEAYLKVGDKRFVKPGDKIKLVGDISTGSLNGHVSKVLPVLRPMPTGQQMSIGRQENYAVLVITVDDQDLARTALSPAQQLTARVRRRFGLFAEPQANAQGRNLEKAVSEGREGQ
jgi:multidrug resistance efflux pump